MDLENRATLRHRTDQASENVKNLLAAAKEAEEAGNKQEAEAIRDLAKGMQGLIADVEREVFGN